LERVERVGAKPEAQSADATKKPRKARASKAK